MAERWTKEVVKWYPRECKGVPGRLQVLGNPITVISTRIQNSSSYSISVSNDLNDPSAGYVFRRAPNMQISKSLLFYTRVNNFQRVHVSTKPPRDDTKAIHLLFLAPQRYTQEKGGCEGLGLNVR